MVTFKRGRMEFGEPRYVPERNLADQSDPETLLRPQLSNIHSGQRRSITLDGEEFVIAMTTYLRVSRTLCRPSFSRAESSSGRCVGFSMTCTR